MDKTACIIFAISGISWWACWMYNTLTEYYEATGEYARYALINRWTGPYFWVFLLPPSIYLLTQLLWIPRFRSLRWLRIALSLIFLIPWSSLLIKIVSTHRDYLPSSWLPISFWQSLIGCLICLVTFVFVLVAVHYFYTGYITYAYKKTKNI